MDEEQIEEYMNLAFERAEEALSVNEVPIGCVFVSSDGKSVLGYGRNRTNETNNVFFTDYLVYMVKLRPLDMQRLKQLMK